MKTIAWTICGLLLALPAVAQPAKQEKGHGQMRHGSAPDAGTAAKIPAPTPGGPTATAKLMDAQGKQVGDATLRQAARGVIVELKVTGVPKGTHAFHIHAVGKCEPPFTSAGGHFNPKKKQHGIENKKGMHAGDFPNLEVPDNGQLQITLFTEAVTLNKGATSVFDKDGSALMIHAGPDDYKSDPAGAAGDRIACGVIEKQQ